MHAWLFFVDMKWNDKKGIVKAVWQVCTCKDEGEEKWNNNKKRKGLDCLKEKMELELMIG